MISKGCNCKCIIQESTANYLSLHKISLMLVMYRGLVSPLFILTCHQSIAYWCSVLGCKQQSWVNIDAWLLWAIISILLLPASVWNRLGAILRVQSWTGDRGNIWRLSRLIYKGRRGSLLCSPVRSFHRFGHRRGGKASLQLGGL